MLNTASSAERQSYNERAPLGYPAIYAFAGDKEPVRFLGTHRGEPIVIRRDGTIEVVAAHRVRVLGKAELP